MANQAISTLPRTTVINGVDTELFPFDQAGNTVAITGTNLLAQLLNLINGHGGIASISSPVVSGRNKTYTITFDDETTTTFTVTDGNGIAAYEVVYAIGDDPSDPTSVAGSYSSTLPEATDENPFTWARLTLTDDDGVDTVIYSVGYKGKDGTAITESTISYGISSSPIVPPSSFSPSFVVTTTENPYQWTRIDTSYSDSALDTTAYCVAAVPFISVDSVSVTTLPEGSDAAVSVSNSISGAENAMAFSFEIPKGDKGETGDYINPVMSYGTSSSAVTEPSTWYNSPSSLDYSSGNFIWAKTDYTLNGAQTVQRTIKSIIGYIGANGTGSGTVTQVTFNGVANLDDGTGNVTITVEPDDVGAIANPTTKNDGQVLTYDSTAGAWVAANPSTGNVNTVNNIGVTAGTTNIDLSASNIPTSDSSNVQAHISVLETDVDGKVSKSGDTMTGDLVVDSALIKVNSTASTSTPSSNEYATVWQGADSGGTVIGTLQIGNFTSGMKSIALQAQRTIGGSSYSNNVRLGVESNGKRTVTFSESAAWLDGLGLGTSGVLPITVGQGGTGQTDVTTISTIGDIADVATNVTVSGCSYAQWGKIAMLDITFTTSAVFSQTTTLFTMKTGHRPKITAPGVVVNDSGSTGTFSARITNTGVVRISGGSIPAASGYHFRSTYILA